jgi:hypothetical protein
MASAVDGKGEDLPLLEIGLDLLEKLVCLPLRRSDLQMCLGVDR